MTLAKLVVDALTDARSLLRSHMGAAFTLGPVPSCIDRITEVLSALEAEQRKGGEDALLPGLREALSLLWPKWSVIKAGQETAYICLRERIRAIEQNSAMQSDKP